VSGELAECDGLETAGHNCMRGSEMLERIVEAQGLVGEKARKDVSGEDFGERAEAEQGTLIWGLVGVGGGLAVSLKEDLMIAHDDEDHAGGPGVEEELGAEGTGGLERGKRV